MSEQKNEPGVTGQTDHEQHRAPEGQGVGAPMAQDTGGPAEMSIFDGKGNESVVVVGDDAKGRRSQGTGATREEAMADTEDPDDLIGDAFSP